MNWKCFIICLSLSVLSITFGNRHAISSGQNFTVPLSLKNPDAKPLEMVYVEAGTFQRGARKGQPCCGLSEFSATVQITDPFWIGKYEITQAQWKAVMGRDIRYYYYEFETEQAVAYGYAIRKDFLLRGIDSLLGDNKPIHYLHWEDAVEFCHRLTIREQNAGRLPRGWRYMLPYDVQWEYAARGGNKSKDYLYSGGNKLEEVGVYASGSIANSAKNMFDVGTKKPNELGLYDMSGNVKELTLDEAGFKAISPKGVNVNPCWLPDGRNTAARGGSIFNGEYSCRMYPYADQNNYFRRKGVGFRIVCAKAWEGEWQPRPELSFVNKQLLKACRERNLGAARQLVKQRRADVNVRDQYNRGLTPLLYALDHHKKPSLELLSFLLKNGADPNLCSVDGVPPLSYAVRYNYFEAAELLLKYGARPGYLECAPHLNHYDIQSDYLAVKKGNVRLLKLMLEKGVDIKRLKSQTAGIKNPEILRLINEELARQDADDGD